MPESLVRMRERVWETVVVRGLTGLLWWLAAWDEWEWEDGAGKSLPYLSRSKLESWSDAFSAVGEGMKVDDNEESSD